jgi:FdhD protein
MHTKTAQYHCLRQEEQNQVHQQELLVVERALQIMVNLKEFSITMQTPGDERYLVRGLLHAEGFNHSEFKSYTQQEEQEGTIVSVEVACKNPVQNIRTLSSTSSCGLCGKKSLRNLFDSITPVENHCEIDAQQIADNFLAISKLQEVFTDTGGCHAASALNTEGEVLCVFEDIGRHNAVDKVVGYLLEHNILNQACVLTVSGRVSFEIIQKCARAGIPILTAISAPSSLAVEMAEKANITLAAFCRGQRATFYSGLHRVRFFHFGIQPLR